MTLRTAKGNILTSYIYLPDLDAIALLLHGIDFLCNSHALKRFLMDGNWLGEHPSSHNGDQTLDFDKIPLQIPNVDDIYGFFL